MSSWALKLSRASGLHIILTSSSNDKLARMTELLGEPKISTVNYATIADWDQEVLKLTDGKGFDLVVENGGTSTLIRSMRCTRRGGTINQVGYLGKQNTEELKDFIPTLIDRRITLR